MSECSGTTLEERLLARLKLLAETDGFSGHEQAITSLMQTVLEPWADRVWADGAGNLYASREGLPGGPKLMIAAHGDEVGGLVKSVEPSGFLRFHTVGLRAWILQARKVRVSGHLGVIGVRPGHFPGKGELPRAEDLYIDVGASSADEVRSMGIGIGSPVTAKSEIEMLSPYRVVGKAIDNRVGCAVLAEVFSQIRDVPFRGTVVGIITTREEVDFGGAKMAAFQVDPGLAIALDTMPCGDTPDVSFYQELPVAIGEGPVIQLMTQEGDVAFIANPGVREALESVAKSEGIPCQLAVVPVTNTDASAIGLSRAGIPTGVVSIPRRYSHSPVEVCDLRDAAGAVNLLVGFVRGMGLTGAGKKENSRSHQG
ncbi:MAG: M20/M25/M40 family metallo-hydrolase [Bacillota bacterium]